MPEDPTMTPETGRPEPPQPSGLERKTRLIPEIERLPKKPIAVMVNTDIDKARKENPVLSGEVREAESIDDLVPVLQGLAREGQSVSLAVGSGLYMDDAPYLARGYPGSQVVIIEPGYRGVQPHIVREENVLKDMQGEEYVPGFSEEGRPAVIVKDNLEPDDVQKIVDSGVKVEGVVVVSPRMKDIKMAESLSELARQVKEGNIGQLDIFTPDKPVFTAMKRGDPDNPLFSPEEEEVSSKSGDVPLSGNYPGTGEVHKFTYRSSEPSQHVARELIGEDVALEKAGIKRTDLPDRFGPDAYELSFDAKGGEISPEVVRKLGDIAPAPESTFSVRFRVKDGHEIEVGSVEISEGEEYRDPENAAAGLSGEEKGKPKGLGKPDGEPPDEPSGPKTPPSPPSVPPPPRRGGPPAPPTPPEGGKLERMTPKERGMEIRRKSQEVANQALGVQEKARNLPSTDRTLGRIGGKTDWTSVGGETMIVGSQISSTPDSEPFIKRVSVYFTKPGAVKNVDESKPITEKDKLAYMGWGRAVFSADKNGNLYYHTEDEEGSPTNFKYPIEASYGVQDYCTSISAQMGTEAANRLELHAMHVQEGEPGATSLPGDHLSRISITLTKETQLTKEEIDEMDRKAYYEGGETDEEFWERTRKRGGVFGHRADVTITRKELDEQGRDGFEKQLRFKDGTTASLLVKTTDERMLEMTLREQDPTTGELIETSCGSMPLDPEGLTDELLRSMEAGVYDVERQVEEHAMPGVAERRKVKPRRLGEPQVVKEEALEERKGIDAQIDQALAEAEEVYERYQAMSYYDREFAGKDLLEMYDLVETTQDGRHYVKPIGDTGLSVVIPGERLLGEAETRLEPPQILLGYAEAGREEAVRQEISRASRSPRKESGEVVLKDLKTTTEGGDVPIVLDPENVEKVFMDGEGVHVVPEEREVFMEHKGSRDVIFDILHETREAGDIHSQMDEAMSEARRVYEEYKEVPRKDRASFVKTGLRDYELVEMEENECLYARPIPDTDLSVAFPGNRWEIGEDEKEPDLRPPQILLGYAQKDQVELVQKAIDTAAESPREGSGEVVLKDLKTTTEGGDVPIMLDPENVEKVFVDDEGIHVVPEFRGVEPGKDLYVDIPAETLPPEQQVGGEPEKPKPPDKPGEPVSGGRDERVKEIEEELERQSRTEKTKEEVTTPEKGTRPNYVFRGMSLEKTESLLKDGEIQSIDEKYQDIDKKSGFHGQFTDEPMLAASFATGRVFDDTGSGQDPEHPVMMVSRVDDIDDFDNWEERPAANVGFRADRGTHEYATRRNVRVDDVQTLLIDDKALNPFQNSINY